MTETDTTLPAAYGGPGWQPRAATTREEMGAVWGDWGAASEWRRLRAVLLHTPGAELAGLHEPDAVQMLAPVDAGRLRAEHEALAEAYRAAGVAVYVLAPDGAVPPNQMFMADLFWMTPEGAILARPASAVRAGEERAVAARLAALGVPILRSVHGRGVFEGADAIWLDERTVMLATGLRTNADGARQVAAVLAEQGIDTVPVDLPLGAMHLMGSVRLLGPRLALVWPAKLPHAALRTLQERDMAVLMLPDEDEGRRMGMNVVALAEREVLMPAGCPRTQALLEDAGVTCHTVVIDEIAKAAGGVGCLTGVLRRDGAAPAGTNGEGRP